MTVQDVKHSDNEDRFVIVGASNQRRVLVVCFTERGQRIRIISARFANRRERKKV
jgi:uncharacterized protein